MNVCAVCEFGSKIRPRPFGCVAMSSAVLFILIYICCVGFASLDDLWLLFCC